MDSRLSEITALGEQAQAFINSDLGQYIIRKSSEEVDAATVELINCEPEDSRKIRKLQTDINVASKAVEWILHAIQDMNNEDINQMMADGLEDSV